jgi:hypothetical protein
VSKKQNKANLPEAPALFVSAESEQWAREDREFRQKLDADRVTAHWNSGTPRELGDVSESPLFGGSKQSSFFPEEN